MALPTLDATFASSADLPRKQMLAKWLVEELGETQAPSNVLVSGLSDTQYNGLYVYDGEVNGRASYRFGSFTIDSGGVGFGWSIRGVLDIASSDSDVSYPWLALNWYNEGIDPTGLVVTESPAPSPLSNYYSLPERYLWAKIAVATGAPKTEADYISLPKNYAWSDIYNAVSGNIAQSAIIVSGAGSSEANGVYTYRGENDGKPYYNLIGTNNNPLANSISWSSSFGIWSIFSELEESSLYESTLENLAYPWLASFLTSNGENPVPTLTFQQPNHTDWSENVALGHIAAAYRGDTSNPANLATYIDWPWRYKVASIIDHLIGNYNAVIVSGAGTSSSNGTYIRSGIKDGKPRYVLGNSFIEWTSGELNTWDLVDSAINDYAYYSNVNSRFPWGIAWIGNAGSEPPPTLTPTNV